MSKELRGRCNEQLRQSAAVVKGLGQLALARLKLRTGNDDQEFDPLLETDLAVLINAPQTFREYYIKNIAKNRARVGGHTYVDPTFEQRQASYDNDLETLINAPELPELK